MESKWQNHPAAKVLSKSVAERMISSLNSGQKNIEEIAELHDSTVSDYGEEKIYKTVERTGGEVGKITSTTAQTSYAKFKLLQNKRQVSFYSQSPMTATHAEGTPIIGRGLHQGQNAKFERIKRYLRQRCIQQQAVQKHLQKQMEQNSKRLASVTNMPSALPFQQGRERVWRKLYRAATWLGKNIIKAVIAVARSLTTMLIALGSAGVIVVLSVLFMAIVAVLLASPLGIIFADQSNDPSAIPIRQIVQETNEEFGQVINDIVEQHPECSEVDIQYIYEEGHTWASYWPEVIAIFAVDANLRGDTDVIVINEGKKDWLKSVFWRMHEIEWWTEQPEGKADDITDHSDDGAAIEIADVLHITVSSLSVKELAEEMNFTDEEKDIMQQLLSDEMRPALLALCGGVAGGADPVAFARALTYFLLFWCSGCLWKPRT